MTISIATSDYIKYKEVIIDGVKLGLRMMNSAESLEVLSIQRKAQKEGSNDDRLLRRLLDIFFNLYDDPEKAHKLLDGLPQQAVGDIYKRVMED